MIGMLNCGNDGLVEFYATPTKARIFKQRTKSITEYTPNGRMFIDGKPKESKTSDELWNELLVSKLATSMVKHSRSPSSDTDTGSPSLFSNDEKNETSDEIKSVDQDTGIKWNFCIQQCENDKGNICALSRAETTDDVSKRLGFTR